MEIKRYSPTEMALAIVKYFSIFRCGLNQYEIAIKYSGPENDEKRAVGISMQTALGLSE
ncbi:hypothetical protein [Paenibacillus sp. PL91]|uniref:hypothetical protein n=1 Tax=Paenibacillus sp. PL91 TaxID=2729538 RepID=UPI00145F9FCE|nr:hypothetical protein [Paenibacillus sp. PL91]MBC9203748.1 hypothetical protein [Paenibacillus sp. PL91]